MKVNSRTESVRAVILVCDMATQCLVHIGNVSLNILKVLELWIAQRVSILGDFGR